MAAANTFGVVAATLQAYSSDLTITASSSPSSTDVTTIILDQAESIRGDCAFVGISTDGLTDSSPSYGVLKSILTKMCLAAIFRARNRGFDADGLSKEADRTLRRLIETPQSVDVGAQATAAETIDEYRTRLGLGESTARGSVVGRIIAGGSL